MKKPLFASKSLKILSILPLIFATIFPLSGILFHIDYICLYAFQFGVMIFCACATSFGFYQLARLYYCFSQAQSYSNTGYSNGLFIFMYTVGILFVICYYILVCVTFKVRLGGNNCEIIQPYPHLYVQLISATIYALWDITTLTLYIIKIREFNRFCQDIHKSVITERIRFILNKIVILSLSVEISIVVSIVGQFGGAALHWNGYYPLLIPVVSSLSNIEFCVVMYCMMEHNDKAYRKLLKVLEMSRLFCCCMGLIENAKIHTVDADGNKEKKLIDETQMTGINNTRVESIMLEERSEYTKTIVLGE